MTSLSLLSACLVLSSSSAAAADLVIMSHWKPSSTSEQCTERIVVVSVDSERRQHARDSLWSRAPMTPTSVDSSCWSPLAPLEFDFERTASSQCLPASRRQPHRAVSFDPTVLRDTRKHMSTYHSGDQTVPLQSPVSGTSCRSSTVDLCAEGCSPAETQIRRIRGSIAGYDNNNTWMTVIAPPTIDEPVVERCKARLPDDEMICMAYVREEEAQDALLASISSRWCYGKAAAKEMDIYRVDESYALHYTLETFTEKRSTSWDQEPYSVTGQRVEGPPSGSAPLPWEIKCNPTQMFQSETQFIEVPHTATISCCYGCAAVGWTRCQGCIGRGFKRCISCCGSGRLWKTDSHGHRHIESCWHCHGTGRKRCSGCSGDGRMVCRVCQGLRNLKSFIKLRVDYTNNFSEYVVDSSELPENLVKNASGEYLLEETQPKICPIADYPVDELCAASQDFVRQHTNAARNTRILMQRHKLRIIAVSDCAYTWANFEGRFWVYGKEMSVYAPDYPEKYCWGCVLM